jgi:DNA polymerase-1
MPAEMRPQEEWLKKNVPLFGLGSLFSRNTEADDLIASYAKKAAADGLEVVIATNDKDILQLTNDRISVYSTAKADVNDGGFALLGIEQIRSKWGVDPHQIGDVLALTGDSSDNIPGVPGVGGKTAAQLLGKFGSLDGLLARLDEVQPDRLRDKLQAARELILANRQMVALDDELPLPEVVENLKIEPKYPGLIDALRACEFKGLLGEVEAEAAQSATLTQANLL